MLRPLIATLIAAAGLASAPPPEGDDTSARFPALQTTITEPKIDGYRMTLCSRMDGKPLCGEELLNAWCRKQGFAGGYVSFASEPARIKAACAPDERWCTPIASITCKGVPIVGD